VNWNQENENSSSHPLLVSADVAAARYCAAASSLTRQAFAKHIDNIQVDDALQ
jgi:hypothetical protein